MVESECFQGRVKSHAGAGRAFTFKRGVMGRVTGPFQFQGAWVTGPLSTLVLFDSPHLVLLVRGGGALSGAAGQRPVMCPRRGVAVQVDPFESKL
jgi:hypothetical protein